MRSSASRLRLRRLIGRRYVLGIALSVLSALELAACGGNQHRASGSPAPLRQPLGASVPAASGSGDAASTACGQAGRPPAYRHVLWIWMENQSHDSVVGSSDAPYENALARQCGSAANYHGITHPSLPNYLAATGGSTFGVDDDDSPDAHHINGASIFGQLDMAGLRWRSYEESMPRPCDRSSQGQYAVKHDPAAYYTKLRAACPGSDLPLGTLAAGALARDLDADTLPSFAFITPNLCHDMHSCSVATGDHWLRDCVTRIVASPGYRSGSTVLFLTWDEADSGNHIPTFVIAPSVPRAVVVTDRFDHYSLLATTEDLLALPRLGAAKTARSMRAAFGL